MLENTDLAVLIVESGQEPGEWEESLVAKIKERHPPADLREQDGLQLEFAAVKSWATIRSLLFVPVSAITRQGIDQFKSSLISISPTGLANKRDRGSYQRRGYRSPGGPNR